VKTILITGASRGIGKGLCEEALRRGYTVHALVRKKEATPSGCTGHVCDVRDREKLQALLEELAPVVDTLVLNAGIGDSLSPRRKESASRAAEIMDVNATSVIFASYVMAHAWIQLGKEPSRKIALISSLAAGRGFPRNEVYIASKSALVSFAQGFEADLAPHGIQLSLILPGFIETDMTRELTYRPGLLTVEEASQRILDGLEKNRFKIAFPNSMIWMGRIRDGMPYFLFRWIVSQLQKRKAF
jgi:NAD(P)-dependent dehydrogenase (short-subunit alcohol dehydrogenase family)